MATPPDSGAPAGIRKICAKRRLAPTAERYGSIQHLIRSALLHRQTLAFIAWVSVGTGTIFLVLSLRAIALCAFSRRLLRVRWAATAALNRRLVDRRQARGTPLATTR